MIVPLRCLGYHVLLHERDARRRAGQVCAGSPADGVADRAHQSRERQLERDALPAHPALPFLRADGGAARARDHRRHRRSIVRGAEALLGRHRRSGPTRETVDRGGLRHRGSWSSPDRFCDQLAGATRHSIRGSGGEGFALVAARRDARGECGARAPGPRVRPAPRDGQRGGGDRPDRRLLVALFRDAAP